MSQQDRPAPSYLKLAASGELQKRVRQAVAMLGRCYVCARVCKSARLAGELGKCRTGRWAVVCSFHPHFGEEPPLVGSRGSGTIFFTHCNLACIYCQNYEISHLGDGVEVSDEQLAAMMLQLQYMGCHNINLVSPTHVVPQILSALQIAVENGLHLPLVYNTGGYDAIPTLRLLEGIVDIYMPDMKYSDPAIAERLSGIKHYPTVNRLVVKEMHRQVGDLVIDDQGIAVRGLLVRHLVLPNGLAGTSEIVCFLAEEISKNTYLNLMDQYRPCYRAHEYPQLNRHLTSEEYRQAVQLALQYGLRRLDARRSWALF
ncbi:MAG: radical SAM protein [Chloroflexi bacterium]|nr:radical SAM protein [Chloroflexota bacterium]MCL5074819.1 radical SAM protein [Chloroflexota bacterium]